jgi:hypothetical protein
MVCAGVEADIATATRMIAAGTNWSFVFAKWNGFILVKATKGQKKAHSVGEISHAW